MTGQRLQDWWHTVAAAASWWHVGAAAALVVAAVVAVDQVRAWQHRRLVSGAQQVLLLAPPQVEPDGAVQMWTTLAAVLRGRWWRRLLFGCRTWRGSCGGPAGSCRWCCGCPPR